MPIFSTLNGNKGVYGKSLITGVTSRGMVLNLDATNTTSFIGVGTTWVDMSASPSNATLTNGPTFTYPYIQFDGTDDFATIASNSKFAFGTGDFTLECWIYPQSFSNFIHMIAFPNQGTMALKASSTDARISLQTPTYSTLTADVGTGAAISWSLNLNAWNHIIMKRESSVAYLYANGLLRGQKTGFTNNFSAQACNIHSGNAGEFAQSRISAVRVYNVALNEYEITGNFNAVRSLYGL
jgi:Concanavalin A-like lectin/glucanases superfamily